MATATQLKTYEDLCQMPDDGSRYELIGGVIVMSPSPNRYHQTLLLRIILTVSRHVDGRNLGLVYVAPFDVRLSPHDVVEPDLLFVRLDRDHIIHDNFVLGAPDLVVEILSPSTASRDLGEKLALYAAAGIPEYWLADPIRKTFQIRVLRNGRYEVLPQVGSVVRSEVLPGLEIDVDELFIDLR